MNSIIIIIISVYMMFNLITAVRMNAKEMKEDFVDGQCAVGKICANLFYAPAWALKVIRFIIINVVK